MPISNVIDDKLEEDPELITLAANTNSEIKININTKKLYLFVNNSNCAAHSL